MHLPAPYAVERLPRMKVSSRLAIINSQSLTAVEGLCNDCLKNRDESIYEMKRRLAAVEKRTHALQSICRSCTGASRPEEIACDSLDCPVYYSRVRETAKFQQSKIEGSEILKVLRAV